MRVSVWLEYWFADEGRGNRFVLRISSWHGRKGPMGAIRSWKRAKRTKGGGCRVMVLAARKSR